MTGKIKSAGMIICFLSILIITCTTYAMAEKKVIKIGSIFGYTGVVSTVQTLLSEGLIDYIKYFNETGGADLHPGLKGYKIEHISVDSGYNIPGFLKQYWSLSEKGCKMIYSYSSQGGDAVKDYVGKDHMPMVAMAITDRQMFPPGWIFGPGVMYADGYMAFVKWALGKHKEKRPLRIVWMTNDNPFGRAPIKRCTAYAKSKGVKIFGPVYIPKVPVDITAELKTVMSYKPDYVLGNISEALPATMATVERMGIHKKDVIFGFWWPVAAAFKMAPKACEKVYFFNPWGLKEEDTRGMKFARTLFKKYRKGKKYTGIMYTTGPYAGRAALGALELALQKVSIDKLNGDNIVKYGWERMKDYDMFGLGPNLTFTGGDRRGAKHTRITTVRNKNLVPVTGYIPIPEFKYE